MIKIFSIPDLDLSQESSVDPMGLQIIWTALGQDIFANKLTTIANDLRSYTFNLFHNHIIFKIYQNYNEELQKSKNQYKAWQTEFDVKAGLLIFLEDLVTNVFYNYDGDSDDIETLGILGINKARMLDNSKSQDQIFLEANKKLGLLKNQLNLGMSGRYKGPMMSMEFFDRTFSYNPKTWQEIEKFMTSWNEAMQLEDLLIQLIVKYLFISTNKEYPKISLQELKRNKLWKQIRDGYVSLFGKRKLPKRIKEFWRDRLGLNSGAPKVLFEEIANHDPQFGIDHEQIFKNTSNKLGTEPSEKLKVDQILSIEPFLSHSEFLIRYLAQQGIKNISDEEVAVKLLRDQLIDNSHFSLDSANPRLKELHKIMISDGPTINWLLNVISFHKKVMQQRGGSAWLDISKEGNIKHYFTPFLSEHLNTIPKYLDEKPWWHTYYLETVLSISKGLN